MATSVRIEPASVERVVDRMRESSRQYAAAAGRLGKGIPVMPPWCLVETQEAIDAAAARLVGLAARADFLAVAEGLRVSSLIAAGAGDIGAALRELGSDLGGEGRRLVGDLQAQPGLTVSPVVGAVHNISGAEDVLAADWGLIEMAAQVLPSNATVHPVKAACARQQLFAMGLSVLRMTPDWGAIDPVGQNQAYQGLLLRTVDARDLRNGDLSRWNGHIGLGLVLGLLTRGAREEAGAAGVSGEASAGDALRTGIEAVGTINRIAGADDDSCFPPTTSMERRAGQAIQGLLQHVKTSP